MNEKTRDLTAGERIADQLGYLLGERRKMLDNASLSDMKIALALEVRDLEALAAFAKGAISIENDETEAHGLSDAQNEYAADRDDMDYGSLKDKEVEFDYQRKDGRTRHVTGVVRIEPNYPADDSCLDVETADNWTEIFDKANIRSMRVRE